MGPGGSRGLQILQLGATSVRGGFDSHAFPPLLLVLALAGAAIAPAAAAQAPPETPVAAPVDSVAPAPPEPALDARREPRPRRPFDEPRYVMLRSLLIPGWGQLANRSWIKAALVAGVEVNLIRLVREDYRALDRLEREVAEARRIGDPALEADRVNAYNARLDALTGRQWWLGAMVAYAMLDAYIDAHFRNFDADFDYDPALPGGEPSARVRLSYRWSF